MSFHKLKSRFRGIFEGYLLYLHCKLILQISIGFCNQFNLPHQNTSNHMATIKFYLDTRREKKDGLFPLKLNVHNKGTFFSLYRPILLHKKKWNGTEFTNKEANYKTKNAALRKMLNDMENAIFVLKWMESQRKAHPTNLLRLFSKKYLPGYVQEKLNSSRTT